MNKLLVALVLGILSHTAFADWTHVSESVTNKHYYISPSSIKDISSGFKQAWIMKEDKNNSFKVATLEQFDCFNGKSKTSHFVPYDSQGTPLGEPLAFGDKPYEFSIPGSVGYTVLQSVCNNSQRYAYNGAQGYASNPGVQTYAYAGNTGGCAENGSCYGDISRFNGQPKTNYVNGYYRSNGTYVRGHYRSR
jgi:hypothetical protein